MGQTFNSGKKVLDAAFNNAVQQMMEDNAKTLESVIENYPAILTSKSEAKRLIDDCLENGYTGRVKYFSEFSDTCKFRDERAVRVKEFGRIQEIIIWVGSIYVNAAESKDAVFAENDFRYGTINSQGSSNWWPVY